MNKAKTQERASANRIGFPANFSNADVSGILRTVEKILPSLRDYSIIRQPVYGY